MSKFMAAADWVPEDLRDQVIKGIPVNDLLRPNDCPAFFGIGRVAWSGRIRQMVGHPKPGPDPVYGMPVYRISELKAFARLYHGHRAYCLFSAERVAEMTAAEKDEWGLVEGQHFGRVA